MFLSKWLRRVALLLLLLLAILLIIGYTYVNDPAIWPIRSVQITTQVNYVEPADIQERVSAYASSSFFAIKMSALQRDLETLPWIESVSIERVWPDTLKLAITEREPIARWKQTALISSKDELFYPEQEYAQELPQLSGDDAHYKEVLTAFKRFDKALSAEGLSIVALDLSPRSAWSAQLDNGLALYLGQDDIDARLARFTKVLHRLTLGPDVVYVDLRYTNGFVLGNNKS
jgi:cell division protein FtsQ